MQDCYKLLNVGDVRKDEASIIEVLTAIKNNKLSNDLRLLNYYKEVPISFGAALDYIDRDVVEMTVHQLQATSMLSQSITLLKSSHFKHDVLAKVFKVRRESNIAFLTQFAYVQILSERRTNVRVQLAEKVAAVFNSGQKQLSGVLDNISVTGAVILAGEESMLGENTKGTVSLSLPGGSLEVQGRFLRMLGDSPCRKYIFELEADSKAEGVISKYIFRLQGDIIRELKDIDL
jgi:hypothetical protein